MNDFSKKKLGRLARPASSTAKSLGAALAMLAAPVTPPATADWYSHVPAWPVDYNDTIGDCTIAAAMHLEQAWSMYATPDTPANPTLSDCLTAYEAVSGYRPADPSNPTTNSTDVGAIVLNVLDYWETTGICGATISGWAPLDVTDHNQIKLAIATFGGIYVGLRLPITAQTSGLVWDVAAGPAGVPGSWGLHAVSVLGYDASGVTVISWGEVIKMTWAAWDAWIDEAYAIVSPLFVNASGVDPLGLTLAQLIADLPAGVVGGPTAPMVCFIGSATAPSNGVGALLTPQVIVAPAGQLATGTTVVSQPGGGAAVIGNVSQIWQGAALSAALLPGSMSASGYAALTADWGGGAAEEATYVPPGAGQSAPVVQSPAWQYVTVGGGAISPTPQAARGLVTVESGTSLRLVGSSSNSGFTAISFAEVCSLEAWLAAVTNAAPAVRRLYLGLLGRAPSGTELAYYTAIYLNSQNSLPAGSTPGTILGNTSIIQAFLGSPEFAQISVSWSASDFVAALYVNALGRAASAAEVSWYVTNMPDRVAQVLAITQSAEGIGFIGYA